MFRSRFLLQTITKLIKNPINCGFSSNPCVRFIHSSRVWHISSKDEEGYSVHKDPTRPPKLFVVQPRLRSETLLKAKLDEALNLANSLEEQRDGAFSVEFGEMKAPPHLVVQNPAARSLKAHADTYFGPGTVESVKYHVNALDSEGDLDAIFVNSILSGVQQRNLEREWGRPVLDRVGLIIEIFNAHAQTKEAKLQSELAALLYKRTRLVRVRGPGGRLTFGADGEAEVVSARGRASGGRGFISGAGETELQLQRRRILERRNHLLSQIEEVRRTRALQRAARKRRGGSQGQGLPTVAVVGYTNAGKSTLVSALSETHLYRDDRLFATVDPHVRSVILPSGSKVLLSDTVGFISDLPVQLIEAFHATLEEVVEADLLVHVLDSSAFNLEEQRSTVLQVLQQIGVSEEKLQNMIEVWNKIDLLENKEDACELEDSVGPGGAGENFESPEEDKDNLALERLTDHRDEDEATCDVQEDIDESDVRGEDEARCDLQEDIDASDLEPEIPYKPTTTDHQATDYQPPQLQHVKTSATIGFGLQELLNLIDDKLRIHPSPARSFDRKWRPPAKEDDSQMEESHYSG